MPRLRRPRSLVPVLRRALAVTLAVVALALAVRPVAAARPPAAETAVPVTVASGELPAGSCLRPNDLRAVGYPPALVPGGAVAEPAQLRGRCLGTGVHAGEPVTDTRLVGAGVTALLPPGQVAAPLRPADLGVTGLVHAGDRVDVLASAGTAARAEVVASGALVLAAPQGRPPESAVAAGKAAGSEGLLLLAVDPPTAARLAAAAASATLSLTFPRP